MHKMKLKGRRPKPKYFLELSNEEAELAFHDGGYYDIDLCAWKLGHHTIHLTFDEWLEKYNIGIL